MNHMTPTEARQYLALYRGQYDGGTAELRALETIAGMRTEYCAQHQAIPGGQWHQVTQWDEDPNPYNAGYGPSDDERIATRYVLDQETDE